MIVSETAIKGVYVIELQPFLDHRGSFTRFFCRDELSEILGHRSVVQVNHSVTRAKGAVRGLHYQSQPCAEMKIVRCIKGRVFDVAVDIRAGSPSLLQHHAEVLSPDNGKMLVVPEGCAHGFQALEEGSELVYLTTAAYAPEFESGLLHADPLLKIEWPLPCADISERDTRHEPVCSDFPGILVD